MFKAITQYCRRVFTIGALGLVCLAGLTPARGTEQNITKIAARTAGDAVVLSLQTSENTALPLKSFSLDNPSRLVIDISEATLADPKGQALPAGAAGITQIRVAQFQQSPGIVRLVCDLSGKGAIPPWRQTAGSEPGEILLQFGKAGPVPLALPKLEAGDKLIGLRLPGCGALARKVGVLDDPPRFFIDLTGAAVSGEETRDFSDGPIKQIRLSDQKGEGETPVARMVVEFREAVQAYAVFADGPDLAIALGEQPWELPLPKYRGAGRLEGKVFVIDPGHGGHDTGARADCGDSGLLCEKDIVLEIGKRLAALLESEGAKVTMTRKDDSYITLAGRAELANRLGADALVSIHCNSCPTPDTLNGTSVYYDHENSRQLAETVQQELIASLGTADKGVRNANFAVIRKTEGQGILVETAFINHQDDRAKLTNENFQERVARAIVQGLIKDFTADSNQDAAPHE
jgi:N-acetylmuramoyl-L-alanine amidase